jgi:hypothetical protein
MQIKKLETGPFAPQKGSRVTISLWMLLFSMMVFALFSMTIMLASRVPIISNSVHDFFGLPQTAKPDKPDRATHLIFLLFCYASPLLLATWIGLLHSAYTYFRRCTFHSDHREESDNPLA